MQSHRIGSWTFALAFALEVGLLCSWTPHPAIGQTTSARSRAEPQLAPGQLSPVVLKKVKAATVFIRVVLPNGQKASGSGFFGVEKGIVLTNAHVLGMLRADSRRPQRVDVTLNSGDKGERTFPGKILGVDPNSDLAVLAVAGADLPAPLVVGPADGLNETQPVYVFGFPFGSQLGRAITVSTSSVSSLRRNNAGVLQRVQVNGGMNPGNSGGPVVDTSGDVVGVAVSMISQTQINFAVPGESVHAMLKGRVNEIVLGWPYRDGGQVKVPMVLRMLDPLGKVKKVGLEYWSGPPVVNGKTKAAPAEPAPGAARRLTATWDVKDAQVSTDLVLPATSAGDAYALRPISITGGGERFPWKNAVFWPLKDPVDRTPVLLKLKPVLNSRNDVKLTSNMTLTVRGDTGEEHALALNLEAGVLETATKIDRGGGSEVRLDFRKLSMSVTLDGKSPPKDARLQSMMQYISQVHTFLKIDSQGTILSNRVDLANVPASARVMMNGIAEQVQKSMEAIEIPMPGSTVQPMTPWTSTRDLPISAAEEGVDEAGLIDMKYKYVGRRVRDGINEAIIDLEGSVRGRKGDGGNIGGRVTGLAYVDLDAGRLISAAVTTSIDLDLTLDRQPVKANGKLVVRFERKPSTGTAPNGPAAPTRKTVERPR